MKMRPNENSCATPPPSLSRHDPPVEKHEYKLDGPLMKVCVCACMCVQGKHASCSEDEKEEWRRQPSSAGH